MSESTSAQLRKLISHRLMRSQESLAEAKVLAEAGHWNSTVSRLYYACFYVVSALLLTRGYSASKHTGIRALFNQHFVNTGLVGKEQAALYNDLFESRQEADYRDFYQVDSTEVPSWISRVESFMDLVTAMVLEAMESLKDGETRD